MNSIELNYRLLRTLARITYSEADVIEAQQLFDHPSLDRALFLGACFRQKVAGLVSLNLTRWRTQKVPAWMTLALRLYYLANQKRNEQIAIRLRRILDEARKRDMDIRPLKGAVLLDLIYKDGGSRLLYDIDFFVRRSQLNELPSFMEQLGFIQGNYNPATNTISKLSREERLLWS